MPLRSRSNRLRVALGCCLAAVFLLLVPAFTATPASAQGQSGRATITGRVADATGASIPGADLNLVSTQTGEARTLKSDAAGLYSFPSLAVGTYKLTATAPTFQTSNYENIELTVGQTAEINILLKPAGSATSVDVSADDIDLTGRSETQNATIISNEVVEDLPTRGRNFTDFALLTPGISQELDRFGLVVNGQRSGNGNISIDGVDFNDPLQNGQRGGPVAAYFFPQVAVLQFAVTRTGLGAEVGRTNAGFVNVVTKSGTNRWHGEAIYSNRNPWLTWPDALNDPEATNNQNQFGVGIGGPIIKDKLFFFAGIEKTVFEVPFFVRIGSNCPTANYYDPNGFPQDAGCAQGAPGAGATALPAYFAGLEASSYGLNNPLASSGRLDWQINSRNTAMLQYMSTFVSNVAYGIEGISQAAISNNTAYDQQSQAVVLGLTTALSSNKTNDAHLQYVYDNRHQAPSTPSCLTQPSANGIVASTNCSLTAPEVDISDFINIGGNTAGTYIYRAIREELNDNFSWLLGKHALRFGFDINLEPETQQREYYPNGLWTVDTLADYIAALPVSQGGGGMSPQAINASAAAGCGGETSACPFQFEQTIPYSGGEPRYVATQREFAGYISDTFRATNRITLSLGLRYDAQLEPAAPVNPAVPGTGVDPSDVTMWQPRLGVAYDIFGNGRTVVRASGGLYDARTPAYILQHIFTDNGQFVASVNSSYDQAILNQVGAYNAFGSISTVPAQSILNDIYTNDPNFRNPRSAQAAFAVEQQLTRRTALVVGFTNQETWKLQHRMDTNLFQPKIDPATFYPVFPSVNPVTNVPCADNGITIPCRPNSTIAGFHENFSTAHSTYRSLIVQLKGNFTKKLAGTVNYTWASTRDDDSNERDADRELALDPLCVSCYNRGYSQQDIRDNLNLNLVYHAPLHFIFSTSMITHTPLPFTAVTSGSKQGDFNNDGNTKNDRPILCSQVEYTICPVSSTQINAYKGGAEVGTIVGRNTFRQKSYNYVGRMGTYAAEANSPLVTTGGTLEPFVSSVRTPGYVLNNGLLGDRLAFLNWGFYNLDMRLIKQFRIHKQQLLEFSAECLNCSRAANLNLGGNATSKFTHAQSTLNTATGFYYSGNSAGFMTTAPDTFRSGGPRQIQLGSRYRF